MVGLGKQDGQRAQLAASLAQASQNTAEWAAKSGPMVLRPTCSTKSLGSGLDIRPTASTGKKMILAHHEFLVYGAN